MVPCEFIWPPQTDFQLYKNNALAYTFLVFSPQDRSGCTKFVSESWLLEPFIRQPCLSGLLIFFICTSFYTTQAVCFTVSDNLVCLSSPPPSSLYLLNLASSIAAASSQVAHQFLTHKIPSVAFVPNISWMHLF